MITKGDKIAFGVIAALSLVAIVFIKNIRSVRSSATDVAQAGMQDAKKGKQKKQKEKIETKDAAAVAVVAQWKMPADLREISGIAYVDDQRFACVQDEAGKIFLYNTERKEVEKEIPFAAPGDYEGIAVVGTTAYVVRADGKLFEVRNYLTQPKVEEHKTPLTAKQDVEGLCYDPKHNRLLLAIKGKEPATDEYKGIYAFDLSAKQLQTAPVYKIDLTHAIFNNVKGKNKIAPSDLDIHPVTGELYVLEGAKPKLLILKEDGTHEQLFTLSTADFKQPEGISFTPSGELYISNEGRNGEGNILKVTVGSGSQ